MSKLTKAQMAALTAIKECPWKSGAFYRDLGHKPVTLASLETRGLIGARWRPFDLNTITRRSWHVTEAGRSVLGGE